MFRNSRNVILMLAVIGSITFLILSPQVAESQDRSDVTDNSPDEMLVRLYAAWWDAEPGSRAEQAAQAELETYMSQSQEQDLDAVIHSLHLQLVQERIESSEEAIQYYGEYLAAESGSEEEKVARDRFESLMLGLDISTEDAEHLLYRLAMLQQNIDAASNSDPMLRELELDALNVFRAYMGAAVDSEAEAEAWREFESLAYENGMDIQQALTEATEKWQNYSDTPANYDEVGTIERLEILEADVELIRPKHDLVAGEPWSVLGRIHNRSEHTIWIVDTYSTLTGPPELFGSTSNLGSISAFFPTIRIRASDEIVRIEPDMEYTVVWKIDPLAPQIDKLSLDSNQRFRQQIARIFYVWNDYLFFIPSQYTIAANVHVWAKNPPELSKHFISNHDSTDIIEKVSNPGDSHTVASTLTVNTEASPWVLIFGAVVGGTLAFFLKMLNINDIRISAVNQRSVGNRFVRFGAGLATALLLTSIATILISRLSASQFLISVQVRDVWGAIATGFIIQWFGFSLFMKLIPTDDLTATEPGKTQDSVANPPEVNIDSVESRTGESKTVTDTPMASARE